jgi:hypothetical protein
MYDKLGVGKAVYTALSAFFDEKEFNYLRILVKGFVFIILGNNVQYEMVTRWWDFGTNTTLTQTSIS